MLINSVPDHHHRLREIQLRGLLFGRSLWPLSQQHGAQPIPIQLQSEAGRQRGIHAPKKRIAVLRSVEAE